MADPLLPQALRPNNRWVPPPVNPEALLLDQLIAARPSVALPSYTGVNQGLGMAGQFAGPSAQASTALSGLAAAPAKGMLGQLGSKLSMPVGKAGMMKGLGYGLAGSIGSGLIDKLPGESNIEQMLQGAAMGGGMGAFLGPWGAGLGAVGGAGLGLLGNTLFKKKKKDPKEQEMDAFSRVNEYLETGAANGLPHEARQSILRQFSLAYKFAEDDASRKAAEQTAKQMVLQMATQNQISPQTKPPTGAELVQMQLAYANAMEPMAAQEQQLGQLTANSYRDMAGQDPASASIYNQMASQATQGADKLANAYRTQALLLPSFQAIQQQQSLANQLAQQQMMAGMYGGGQQQGAMDLSTLLAQ